MKINIVAPAKDRGSILLVALVISAVLGITLASYLTLVSFQSRSVVRSQHWNQALVVAEAGIEEALQMVNKNGNSPDLTKWDQTYAGDGWSRSGAVYSLSRSLNAAGTLRYSLFITNLNVLNTEVIITSIGSVTLPSSIASSSTVSRTVVIRAKINTLFNVAMAALGTIDLKGNGVATDSYDSNDPKYSTNGVYTPLRRKANGDVATNNTITNSVLSVGNANVAGHIITGPYGSVNIGANGSVGDLAWVDANTKGIKAGYQRNDMNVAFDNVELPSTSWIPSGSAGSPAGGSGKAPNGITYGHVFTTPGDYVVTDNGSIYVGTNTTVRIKATTGSFGPSIYIAGMDSAAGKLVTYVTGTSADVTAVVIQSGRPASAQFFGLPSLKDIAFSGNGTFTGVIYAPQATFTLSGGGNNDIDFIGSSVTQTVKMNGHFHFHYDEALKVNGPADIYKASDWNEL